MRIKGGKTFYEILTFFLLFFISFSRFILRFYFQFSFSTISFLVLIKQVARHGCIIKRKMYSFFARKTFGNYGKKIFIATLPSISLLLQPNMMFMAVAKWTPSIGRTANLNSLSMFIQPRSYLYTGNIFDFFFFLNKKANGMQNSRKYNFKHASQTILCAMTLN